MDLGQAEGIGDVLLAWVEGEGMAVHHVARGQLTENFKDQSGDAYPARPPAEVRKPPVPGGLAGGHILQQFHFILGLAPQKIAELFLVERAQADGCRGLRRMGHGLEPKRVQADEASRQQEIQDLTAPFSSQKMFRLGETMRSLNLADWRNFRALTGTPE